MVSTVVCTEKWTFCDAEICLLGQVGAHKKIIQEIHKIDAVYIGEKTNSAGPHTDGRDVEFCPFVKHETRICG